MTLSEKQGDLTEEGKQLAGTRCLVNSRKRSSWLGVSWENVSSSMTSASWALFPAVIQGHGRSPERVAA